MSEYPEDGRFETGVRDPVTGIAWVKVTRAMAHAHPKGQLGAVLYAIVLYFVAVSAMRTYEFVKYGFEPALLVYAIVAMLAALGLYFRVPFALVLVVLLFVVSGYSAVTGIENLTFLGLVQLIISGAAAVYLITGERPNLIYRHRYRSYGEPQ